MQKSRWKITDFIGKKALNVVDFTLISEHLSPLPICNKLISNQLQSTGDSDRCFATFLYR